MFGRGLQSSLGSKLAVHDAILHQAFMLQSSWQGPDPKHDQDYRFITLIQLQWTMPRKPILIFNSSHQTDHANPNPPALMQNGSQKQSNPSPYTANCDPYSATNSSRLRLPPAKTCSHQKEPAPLQAVHSQNGKSATLGSLGR